MGKIKNEKKLGDSGIGWMLPIYCLHMKVVVYDILTISYKFLMALRNSLRNVTKELRPCWNNRQ